MVQPIEATGVLLREEQQELARAIYRDWFFLAGHTHRAEIRNYLIDSKLLFGVPRAWTGDNGQIGVDVKDPKTKQDSDAQEVVFDEEVVEEGAARVSGEVDGENKK